MDNYSSEDNDFKGIGALVMILAVTPKLIKTVKEVIEEVGSFPTFPTKVVNMHVMWSTIAKCNGWEIQQNLFTRHCRIIDPNNIRQAWGTYEAMKKALEVLQNITPE